MPRYSSGFLKISDLYRAYRKAKADAFYESAHFHALAYAKYEARLEGNLKRLHALLMDSKVNWAKNAESLGGVSFFPKSVGVPDRKNSDGVHFATSDPASDWKSACETSGEVKANFRQIITPTVDFQVISALWVMLVGHEFDAVLDAKASYGHRLRRLGSTRDVVGKLNLDCNGLFAPYFSAYRRWRWDGLEAMRKELKRGREIYAVTMDVKSFYHSISPVFILRQEFLEEVGIILNENQDLFTRDFLNAMGNWYYHSPDYKERPAGGLPVGLSASKIISNVLLVQFDRVVREILKPVHYGRYVDDVFLVVRSNASLKNGVDFMRWVAETLAPYVVFRQFDGKYSLKFEPAYALDSEILFSGDKQKIFHLKGQHGLDLVGQISEQIRKQSSEHRLLPILPEHEGEMLSQALLATPDASLEADALRKADAVSLRRLGFSLLVRDVEGYARDLTPKDWRKTRHVFYGLVSRYVLTPRGYFDYFAYICRAFGLMIACGDFKAASNFLVRFNDTCRTIEKTTSGGGADLDKFHSSKNFYVRAFVQVALQASTVKSFAFGRRFSRIMSALRGMSDVANVPVGIKLLQKASRALLLSDLGRRPYREYWYKENVVEKGIPKPPVELSINKILRLDLIRNFRKSITRDWNPPYWPAVVFPTRPLTIPEITAIAPELLQDEDALRDAILGLRGARVVSNEWPYSAYVGSVNPRLTLCVPSVARQEEVAIAVTSYYTSLEQWQAAYDGAPDRSQERYEKFRRIVNKVLQSSVRPDYVSFPELSLPRRWAFAAAIKFSQNGVSLIAGLENNNKSGFYRNDALVSLTTRWPGYRTHIYHVQPKIAPAHHELVSLADPPRELFPADIDRCRPIYAHGNHSFSVVICSDLTSISNRAYFQGGVDTLFVIEWNQDLNTFSYLVESASHDLHAFIVQANNRQFGDSRIRGPFAEDFRRDVVRVRGGVEDYFVVSKINIAELRKFQVNFSPVQYEESKKEQLFKPLPIGFELGDLRK